MVFEQIMAVARKLERTTTQLDGEAFWAIEGTPDQ
jgi:hypothetical protein